MAASEKKLAQEILIEEFTVKDEPFYVPVGDEIELFEAAYAQKLPILFKGPTGCGKTRFIEHMSWRLQQHKRERENNQESEMALITIACHEDLTSSDLVGRYLLEHDSTRWIDGPLTRAVKVGAICYLDEVVEARKDTTVLIHPLTDHRRLLPIEKLGVVVEAHDEFLLVISYNPGYQSAIKDLKHSTRQRFVSIEFDYPPRDLEAEIIQHESGVDAETATQLALLGEKVRNLREYGLQEGASTRLLIYAGKLVVEGISPRRAAQVAVTWAITDEQQVQRSVEEVAAAIFE
jgi:nitric oxide reductase NorQ protein